MKTRHPILLVDDEPEILFSLRGLLRHDFEVHTASGGAEALALLRQHPVHVIMTDQRMPEMTGVELLRWARAEWPEAVRIVFTGYADIKAVVDAINEGQIYRYLTKPWDPGELVEVLRQACEHYERTAERRRLLLDLKDHLLRCQEVLPSLPPGQAEPLLQAGAALLARLEGASVDVR
jgi:DNA-binding NtrC family response regulator